MREFAESEIIIPDGPFEGRRFRCDRQPLTRPWFDAVDGGKWRRLLATGPQQSGKTLIAFVLPLMYHLFEIGENVICGLPNLDMVADKWAEDIFPAIQASRYRELLPRSGAGSRGGRVDSRIQFTHGPTLRFMTGGGGDKSRAGFTSRVVVITETDGMDESGGSSREADKITQLEGRTRAFGDRARIYLECTVSTEEGRTWQEYLGGTRSRLAIRCPHCQAFVTPEREHLIGWQDATDLLEAGERSQLVCPACGVPWDESDRREANADARVVHHGQEIAPDGTVTGQPPRTDTLGFRWTAANNLLVRLAVVGQDEWKSSRAADEANAEKAMRQFVWALPSQATAVNLTQLDAHMLALKRMRPDPRGRIPTGAQHVTAAIDLGKYLCHWIVVAWMEHASPHVVEYGRIEVASGELGEERSLLAALREFRDLCLAGWPADAGPRRPDLSFVDSGWQPEVAYAFCGESGQAFLPSKGIGVSQEKGRPYREQKQTGSTVVSIGEGYHVVRLPNQRTVLVEVNADHWKSWLHARLQTPLGQPGAMTFHQAETHLSLAKHLTAERKVEEFVAGKGLVTRWEMVHRNNHWLDAAYLACAAGHGVGERLIQTIAQQAPKAPPKPKEAKENSWIGDRSAWGR